MKSTSLYSPVNTDEIEELRPNDMVNTLIAGYLNEIIPEVYYHDYTPPEIETLCQAFFGTFGIDGDLVVGENQTCRLGRLDEKSIYEFSSILIKKNGTLTVSHPKQILNIKCFGDIVLEMDAKINLDGMGYKGGRRCGDPGESYI
eukprot:416756_1